jgi:hypothetical protein
MRILTLSVALFYLVACGSIEDFQQQDDESSEVSEVDESQRRTTVPRDTGTEVNVDVDVEVNVDVNSGEEPSGQRELVYRPNRVNYYSAESNAPEGYRLAERAELIDLFDKGYLTDFDVNEFVWTGTEAASTTHWVFGLWFGNVQPYDHEVLLPTIYIER